MQYFFSDAISLVNNYKRYENIDVEQLKKVSKAMADEKTRAIMKGDLK